MARFISKPKRSPATEHLQFDVQRMLKIRGVQTFAPFMKAAGISYKTALDMVAGRYGSIKWSQMEKLCLALNCTPNDLFKWKGDGSDLPANSELLKLIRPETSPNIMDKLKGLSVEDAEKLLAG